jgi:lipopolysaccharide cholinephosphotransferase
MKSDSALMNELAHHVAYLRELTADESAGMKRVLLEIYHDVANVCEQYGLTYMLCGGSCLGAVRHQGFIPWDDDLDLMMPRADYERLIKLCNDGALGNKYEIDYPNGKTDSKTVFLKIYRKNSLNVELCDESTPFPKGIYIDIFALDAVPAGRLFRLIKGFFANVFQFIAIMVLYAQYPSRSLKEFMALDVSLRRRFRLKMFFGRLFSLVSHRWWVYWFDRFVASDAPNRKLGIPTGRKYYNGEIFERSVFLPPRRAIFEGLPAYIPAEYDRYLTNLYHDYMQLPPVEKRERHFIGKFQLPTD